MLRFQQQKFLKTFPEAYKGVLRVDPGSDHQQQFQFWTATGSGPAFARMTAQVFEEATRNTQRLPELEALDIPVELIWKAADLDLNTGVAEDLRSHLKDASLAVLPAGHWLQVDMPEAVAREMLS